MSRLSHWSEECVIIEVGTEIYEYRSNVLSGGTGWDIRGGNTWCRPRKMRKNQDGWIGPLKSTFSSLETSCLQRHLVFMSTERAGGLMIHWGPGPQLLWREGEWKWALAAEPKKRTLPRQGGDLPRRKERVQGLGLFCLGSIRRFAGCWYATGMRTSCPESLVRVVVSTEYLKMWHTSHTNLTATTPWVTAWNNSSLEGYFKMQLSSRSFH